ERVQRVAEQEAPVGLDDDVLEVVPARRVDEAEEPRRVDVGVARSAAVQLGQHRLRRQPVLAHRLTVSPGPGWGSTVVACPAMIAAPMRRARTEAQRRTAAPMRQPERWSASSRGPGPGRTTTPTPTSKPRSRCTRS